MAQAVVRTPAGVRQTKPSTGDWYQRGFFGIIPRRGMSSSPLLDARTSLLKYAQDTPLRLMAILPDIHPSVGLATWNALRLACAQDDLRIIAVPVDAPDDSEDADDAGTALLSELWKSLPSEIGGLQGLQTTLTMQAMFTGLICLEAVPGARGQGVTRIWPVDSLTVFFGRDDVQSDVQPYQRQIGGQYGYVRLDTNRFFWRSVDAWVDDPYGRAPYATALAEVLRDLAMISDLNDAIHHAAWPRVAIPFNFTEAYKIAVEVMGMRDPNEASEWVQGEFEYVRKFAENMKADDALLFDTNTSGVTVIEGGKGMGNALGTLEFLRNRLLQSLKTLPTLMGINDGSTQTYTTVEWRIYAEGLETMRGMVADLLAQAATLHLRLCGVPLKAKAVLKRIRTSDEQMDAATEATKIANAVEKRDQGWIDQDQASNEITGKDAVTDPPMPMPDPSVGTQPPQLRDLPFDSKQELGAGERAEIARRWRERRIAYERLASGLPEEQANAKNSG